MCHVVLLLCRRRRAAVRIVLSRHFSVLASNAFGVSSSSVDRGDGSLDGVDIKWHLDCVGEGVFDWNEALELRRMDVDVFVCSCYAVCIDQVLHLCSVDHCHSRGLLSESLHSTFIVRGSFGCFVVVEELVEIELIRVIFVLPNDA